MNKNQYRKFIGIVLIVVMAVAMLIFFKSTQEALAPLGSEEAFRQRHNDVNPNAVSSSVATPVKEHIRNFALKSLPSGYAFAGEDFCIGSNQTWGPVTFEYWMLATAPSGETVSIIYKVHSEHDAELLFNCVTKPSTYSIADIPEIVVTLAPLTEEEAHFYLSIP